jgi:hypothetical protein
MSAAIISPVGNMRPSSRVVPGYSRVPVSNPFSRSLAMKYMTRWSIKEDNFAAVLERFTTNDPQTPEGVTMLGRWHQMGSGDGFALIETDDPVGLSRFIMAWADLVDQQVYAVVEDADIAAALS